MEISLTELIASIGTSVQAARRAVDECAAQLYFQGFDSPMGEEGVYRPVAKRIELANGGGPEAESKVVCVPVTALMNHQSMRLDQVDVKMKLAPCDVNGALKFRVGPGGEEDAPQEGAWAEFSLSFQSGDMPEGTARLNQKLCQFL